MDAAERYFDGIVVLPLVEKVDEGKPSFRQKIENRVLFTNQGEVLKDPLKRTIEQNNIFYFESKNASGEADNMGIARSYITFWDSDRLITYKDYYIPEHIFAGSGEKDVLLGFMNDIADLLIEELPSDSNAAGYWCRILEYAMRSGQKVKNEFARYGRPFCFDRDGRMIDDAGFPTTINTRGYEHIPNYRHLLMDYFSRKIEQEERYLQQELQTEIDQYIVNFGNADFTTGIDHIATLGLEIYELFSRGLSPEYKKFFTEKHTITFQKN